MQLSHRRSGFTLYHLLVILAIIAILLAFLFPAVQKVREAAARTQSQNNMKQIMLGMHSYHDTHNVLPPGNDEQNFSGLTHILPYIEQGNLYKQLNLKKPMDDEANSLVRGAQIRIYLSPVDGRMSVVDGWGPTSYMLNAGSQASLEKNNGPFYDKSKVRFVLIPDGLSNTAGVVENLMGDGQKTAMDLHRQHVELKADALKGLKEDAGVEEWKNNKSIVGTRGASWMDGRFLQSTMNAGRPVNSDKPDVNCGGMGGWSGPRTFKNVFNVGMCDGSVRAASANVSFETWKRVMSANDGQAIGDDF